MWLNGEPTLESGEGEGTEDDGYSMEDGDSTMEVDGDDIVEVRDEPMTAVQDFSKPECRQLP